MAAEYLLKLKIERSVAEQLMRVAKSQPVPLSRAAFLRVLFNKVIESHEETGEWWAWMPEHTRKKILPDEPRIPLPNR